MNSVDDHIRNNPNEKIKQMNILQDQTEYVPDQISDTAFREFLNNDKEKIKMNNLDQNQLLASKRSEEQKIDLMDIKKEPSRRASLKTVSKVIADSNFSKQKDCGYISSIEHGTENKTNSKQAKDRVKVNRDISFEKINEENSHMIANQST